MLLLVVFAYVHVLKSKGFNMIWTKSEEGAKKLFEAQVERYYKSMFFILLWHAGEIALGKGLDTWTVNQIACAEDGCMWIYIATKGSIFIMIHIIGAMLSAGVARTVFVKTTRAVGFLGGLDEEDECC